MRYMATYDMMETLRNANQWLGATALSFASYPIFSMTPNPAFQWLAAWGEVTERTFDRMVTKPDWGIRTFTCEDGKDHLVSIDTVGISNSRRQDCYSRLHVPAVVGMP